MKYIGKYPLRSCWTTLYDVCQDGEGREVSEIPDGAEGDHEGEHHGDVEAVVKALEEPAPVVLEDGPQVLGTIHILGYLVTPWSTYWKNLQC